MEKELEKRGVIMKRILFDTSVYGELVTEIAIVDKIVKHVPKDFIIYGNKVIRKELRETSKDAKLDGKSKRILLLQIYDLFVKKDSRDLKITDIIEIIAQDYFVEYRKNQGAIAYKKIINDFRIVACASLHNLDIVVSHDTKSMLGDKAILAYKKVNQKYQLRNPEFTPYIKFKQRFV